MDRMIVFASAILLTSLSLHAEIPRACRHGFSAMNAANALNSGTVVRPRRGKHVAFIETTPSYTAKKFISRDVTQWTPSPAKSVQVAALPSPALHSVPDNISTQNVGSLPPVATYGFPSNGLATMETGSTEFVLAKERTLTPTLEDGVNDAAVFGPGAEVVYIRDIRGRRIFHARRTGVSPLRWDCRGPAGKFVEEGVYFALILNQDGIEFRQSFTVLR